MMIDKLRKRLNNSASLGKTLARTQQQQQQQNFSYFAEPREFDLRSLNDKSLSKKASRKDPISTPKQASIKAVPANLCIGESLLNIQLNRQRCGQLSQDVHTASMAKNLRVNRLYKELHHFSVCVDELRWLLSEGDTLIRAYLAQTTLIAPNSSHTLDVANISQEFRSLVLRFAQIEKEQLAGIEECLRTAGREQGITIGRIMTEELKQAKPMPTFPEGHSMISSKEQGRDIDGASFLQTRHFSVPLKENINSSNLPHFENIKILKSESTKQKGSTTTNQKQQPPPLTLSIKENMNEQSQDHQKEKDQLYKKLRQEHERNETLLGSIEMLKEQVSNLQRKLSTYTIASRKSIERFGEVLKRLMGTLTQQEKQFQLLKMAQSLSTWQKMIDDDTQQAKYRELYCHPEAMQGEKTIKLKEIIELQYDINNLLAQKQHLQRMLALQAQREVERAHSDDEVYRMLVMQAVTLEELCQL